FESEEAMRKADEAMNAGPGNAGSRGSLAGVAATSEARSAWFRVADAHCRRPAANGVVDAHWTRRVALAALEVRWLRPWGHPTIERSCDADGVRLPRRQGHRALARVAEAGG